MSGWIIYAVYGLLIGAGLLAADALMRVLSSRSQRDEAKARLDMHSPEARARAAQRRADLTRREAAARFGPLARHLLDLHLQSGAAISAPKLATGALVFGGALAALVYTVLRDPLLALFFATLGALGAPYLMLHMERSKRQAKFIQQLPDALDVMIRSLRAGHPLTMAITLSGRDLPAPAGPEFSMCAQEMIYGLPLEAAIRNLSQRVGVNEADVVAGAISIQQRSGGNLIEVLARLSGLMRDRARMKSKAKALSAEGRYSAILLCILPFLLFAGLLVVNPNYYGAVREDPLVAPALAGTMAWMVVGMVFINRMVNFRV